jgi:hypothetical protein
MDESENLERFLKLIKEKFTSGNDIPVERITITRKEYDEAGIESGSSQV